MAGRLSGIRTSPATGPTGGKTAKGAVLLAAVLAVTVMAVAVAAAPALAQTSGNLPDYVLEEDGTVVIDGDFATDCPSFALALEEGYELAGNPERAQAVLEQCEEAGLLPSGGTIPSASPGTSASASAGVPAGSSASGGGGGGGLLPDTGGPDLPALLVVSGVVAMTSGLLAGKVANG